jgi:hypothetical protein
MPPDPIAGIDGAQHLSADPDVIIYRHDVEPATHGEALFRCQKRSGTLCMATAQGHVACRPFPYRRPTGQKRRITKA